MAKLGVRTVDELVGRTDLLKVQASTRQAPAASDDGSDGASAQPADRGAASVHFDPEELSMTSSWKRRLDMKVLLKKFKKDLDTAERKAHAPSTLDVANTDRALGTIFGSEITAKSRQHPAGGYLPSSTATAAAARALAPSSPRGLTLELEGDANDYLGKGLSGGKIVVYPPKDSHL